MKQSRIILAAAAALALLLGGPALAQELEAQETPPPPPEQRPEFKPLESDKLRQLPSPEETRTSFHGADKTPQQRMARFVGTWDVQGRVWVAPDADPVPAVGTAIYEWVLDGVFLHTRFKGEMMGETFSGVGYETWSEARQKHIGTWMDSTESEIFQFEGGWDETGNVLTTQGKVYDAEKQAWVELKTVTTFRSSSMFTYESTRKNEAGEWVKSMDAIFGKLK